VRGRGLPQHLGLHQPGLMPLPADGLVHAKASPTGARPVTTCSPSTA
jgi:hypothetical protein